MEDNFVTKVVDLYTIGDWKEILNRYHNHPDKNKLLWVFPSEKCLNFIRDSLDRLNCNSILSVGCGSGLLEWIIFKATGVLTQGIEVDGAWWSCKYSPPTFIPLHYALTNLDNDTPTQKVLSTHTCLMFCYFNNRGAFNKYLQYFLGKILIIIGPGEGRGTHTNPTPFNNNLDSVWKLFGSQEVRNTKDFMAVYVR